jgi:hypothetical protein
MYRVWDREDRLPKVPAQEGPPRARVPDCGKGSQGRLTNPYHHLSNAPLSAASTPPSRASVSD